MPLTLRSALRQLQKTPGFTATALATLAICIAANLTIFAVVDAILLRPLPFPEPGRLVTFINSYPGAGVERSSASLPNYLDRKAMKSFSASGIYQDSSNIVGDAGSPERVETARVSADFFSTLGVALRLGRTFGPNTHIYGSDTEAVLTDGFWRSHFNADPNVVGKTFINDGTTVTVVGVLPPGFHYLSSRARFFRPAAWDKDEASSGNRHSNNWDLVARLAPDVTLTQAQSEMDGFNALQLKDDPYAKLVSDVGYRTWVRDLRSDFVREMRPILVLLQVGVLFLLLIGGVNLANLLLIRASSRMKELAVRQALGASHWHIARDVLTETLLLSLAGGAGGVLIGGFGIDLLRRLGTDKLPLGADIAFDARVAAVALAGSLLVGFLLALPALWFNLHTRLAAGLQAESRSGTAGQGAQRVRHVFIVAQVALAFVLLSGAGLLTVSLRRLMAAPTGLRVESVFSGQIDLPWKAYPNMAKRRAFAQRVLPAVQALPGVLQVALTSAMPFGSMNDDSALAIEGMKYSGSSSLRAHYCSSVTPDYFSLMGIGLVRGRIFTAGDVHDDATVVIVDEALAERYWPGQDPIGRRLTKGPVFDPKQAAAIVGVVRRAKRTALTEDVEHGMAYFPFPNNQTSSNSFSLVVRAAAASAMLAPMVEKTILQLDPNLPIDDFRPLEARIDDSLVERRSPAILAAIFAGIALLLAGIGTYGVLSYAVAQRQREIGVRMSLGALPAQIRNQFLRHGLVLLGAGTVLGIAGAWLTGRAMQSVLYQVPALEATTLAVTAVVMALVSLAACLVPATRAARVDPIIALRGD